jgi:hypothetical protein
MTLRASEMTSVPQHAYDRVQGHVELPPTPNPEPADSEDITKTAAPAAKSQKTSHLDWLTAHERVLQRSVNNKTGVVTRDVPILVSGEDLSLAELVAVAQ